MDVFKKLILDVLTSKKFLATITGIVVAMFAKRGIGIDETTINQILVVITGYIVGQGIADNGKEAAKIDRGL